MGAPVGAQDPCVREQRALGWAQQPVSRKRKRSFVRWHSGAHCRGVRAVCGARGREGEGISWVRAGAPGFPAQPPGVGAGSAHPGWRASGRMGSQEAPISYHCALSALPPRRGAQPRPGLRSLHSSCPPHVTLLCSNPRPPTSARVIHEQEQDHPCRSLPWKSPCGGSSRLGPAGWVILSWET